MSVTATVPTVSEVLSEGREIIAVHSTDTVHQVIRALGENGIFSGNVFSPRLGGSLF